MDSLKENTAVAQRLLILVNMRVVVGVSETGSAISREVLSAPAGAIIFLNQSRLVELLATSAYMLVSTGYTNEGG